MTDRELSGPKASAVAASDMEIALLMNRAACQRYPNDINLRIAHNEGWNAARAALAADSAAGMAVPAANADWAAFFAWWSERSGSMKDVWRFEGLKGVAYDAWKAALATNPKADVLAAPAGRLGDSARYLCRKCGEQNRIEFNSARVVTRRPDDSERDPRDIASDPEGRLIYDSCRPLMAAGALDAGQPLLTVRLTSFPESNGKRNWTAMFKRAEKFDGLIGNAGGITIARGECWNRVAYHAEEARFLLGERSTEPDIMAYGDDVHTPQEWSGKDADGVFAIAKATVSAA